MKFFALAILLITMLVCAWADETCSIDGKTLQMGETHKPADDCKLLKCNGKEMEVADVCVPLLHIATNCTFVDFDYSKPFPDCCVRLDC